MEIRPLVPGDDRTALSRIYEESWKFAYRGILPQEYLDSIPAGSWVSVPDGRQTLVCEDQGRLAGTASFGGSRFPQFPNWGEVISIYLLPEYLGRGCGRMLMEAAVAELGRQGYGRIFLWVLEENRRARRFYERFGFLPTDDYMEPLIGGRAVREVRYIYTVSYGNSE